jgi:hypothetical protein
MKRVRIDAYVADKVSEEELRATLEPLMEISNYHEDRMPSGDILDHYSMDSLLHAIKDFANGIWQSMKAFGFMLSWSVVIIASSLRWLWRKGIGGGK